MRIPRHITVEASIDHMGCLMVTPVNDRIGKCIADHLRDLGETPDASLFIQSDRDAEAFIRDCVPARYRADLRRGWSCRFRIDPWLFGMYRGWDTQELF